MIPCYWINARRIAMKTERRSFRHPTLGWCWLWCGGSRLKGGYVQTSFGGRRLLVHRWAYELLVGPIPEGLTIDHLCRSPSCVRPSHLEPVTRRENNLRSNNVGGVNARKTHCPAGHPYDETNTIHYRDMRYCRPCVYENIRRYRERKKVTS